MDRKRVWVYLVHHYPLLAHSVLFGEYIDWKVPVLFITKVT